MDILPTEHADHTESEGIQKSSNISRPGPCKSSSDPCDPRVPWAKFLLGLVLGLSFRPCRSRGNEAWFMERAYRNYHCWVGDGAADFAGMAGVGVSPMSSATLGSIAVAQTRCPSSLGCSKSDMRNAGMVPSGLRNR